MANVTSEKKALEILAQKDGWENAYSLAITLGTLRKLHVKGKVQRRNGPGAIAFPTVGITWKIKK